LVQSQIISIDKEGYIEKRVAIQIVTLFLTLSKDNWIKQFPTLSVDFSGTSQLNCCDFEDHNHK